MYSSFSLSVQPVLLYCDTMNYNHNFLEVCIVWYVWFGFNVLKLEENNTSGDTYHSLKYNILQLFKTFVDSDLVCRQKS